MVWGMLQLGFSVLSIDWVMGLQALLMVREWYIGTAGFSSSIDGLWMIQLGF